MSCPPFFYPYPLIYRNEAIQMLYMRQSLHSESEFDQTRNDTQWSAPIRLRNMLESLHPTGEFEQAYANAHETKGLGVSIR